MFYLASHMKTFISLLLILVHCIVYSQQYSSATPCSSAPANASVAYTKKWTGFHNPAIISSETNNHVSLNYDNRFELKELSTKSLSVSFSNALLNCGLALSYFGYKLYNETQIGVAFSREFTSCLSMGIQCNYYNIYFSSDEGNKGSLITQIGLLSKIAPNLQIGFHAYNPTQSKLTISSSEKRIPSIFSLGANYFFNENIRGIIQVDKEIEYPLIWRCGFEYFLLKKFTIRLGGYGNPFTPCIGTSLSHNKFCLNINVERHQILGVNSNVELSYSFK
jgi:hypothetical protein